jgi:hypothetical protein
VIFYHGTTHFFAQTYDIFFYFYFFQILLGWGWVGFGVVVGDGVMILGE